MFKTSLYIISNQETTREQILQSLASQESQKKIEGMKNLISQMSQGKFYESITHTVIKDVISDTNNELRRLFYYFLELSLPQLKDNELLLLGNQIRKDLEHPNEFMRGAVLRFVSAIASVDILLNFHKPILDNFNHPIAFVRRNAYYCLGTLSLRLGIFEDTNEALLSALQRDSDPDCLCQAFSSLYDLDKPKATAFAYEILNQKCVELSKLMISKVREPDFLLNFMLDDESTVRIEACLVLLDVSCDEFVIEKCVGVLMASLKDNKSYFAIVFQKLMKISNIVNLSSYSMPILEHLDPYDLDTSKAILDFVCTVSATKDFLAILKIITHKYRIYAKMTLKTSCINVLLLEKLTQLVFKYSVYAPEVVALALEGAFSESPTVSYESLNLLRNLLRVVSGEEKDLIIQNLISNLTSIQFGKLFRLCLSLIVESGGPSHFEETLKVFRESLALEANKPLWMGQENAFLLSFISISLTEMYYNTPKNSKTSLLALLLLIFKYIKENKLGCTNTVVSCIRRLQSTVQKTEVEVDIVSPIQKTNVGDPFDFPFLRVQADEKIDALSKFLLAREQKESINNVYQLTGLSDPIYVESSVIYSRFEIVLDILFINQTDHYLQNMLFDFGSSPNLKPSYVSTPDNMKARSAVSRKLVFKVLDSANGFINGSVTFKYPSASGEYANQSYTLNFSEIKTYVSDFLEPLAVSPEDFRELWKKMEWENVYSVKLASFSGLKDIFGMFKRKLKGFIVDCQDGQDYLVGNIASTTKQNNNIFFNVCMTRENESLNLECRVRSSKEEIVKSLNDILNEVVKSNKRLL